MKSECVPVTGIIHSITESFASYFGDFWSVNLGMSRVPLVRDYYPSVSPLCPVSPGAAARDLWIGEETKRAMPPHVYKYYLQRTKCYRRQSIKVSIYLAHISQVSVSISCLSCTSELLHTMKIVSLSNNESLNKRKLIHTKCTFILYFF